MAPPKTPTNGTPTAAAGTVRALANDLAAGFTAAAIEQAHDALKRELEARTFPDGGPTGLTPMELKMLEVLVSHPRELVAATTVPSETGGEK